MKKEVWKAEGNGNAEFEEITRQAGYDMKWDHGKSMDRGIVVKGVAWKNDKHKMKICV